MLLSDNRCSRLGVGLHPPQNGAGRTIGKVIYTVDKALSAHLCSCCDFLSLAGGNDRVLSDFPLQLVSLWCISLILNEWPVEEGFLSLQ